MNCTIEFWGGIQQQTRCDCNSKRLICKCLKCYLCSPSRYFINLGLKWNRSLDINYFRIWLFFSFLHWSLLFSPSCPSLEVQTWKRTAPVALSATEKFVLTDTCMYSHFYQKIYYLSTLMKVTKGYNLHMRTSQ
jgi:hypothetical protein